MKTHFISLDQSICTCECLACLIFTIAFTTRRWTLIQSTVSLQSKNAVYLSFSDFNVISNLNRFNLFQHCDAFNIEISHYIYSANQMSGFYLKCETGLKLVEFYCCIYQYEEKYSTKMVQKLHCISILKENEVSFQLHFYQQQLLRSFRPLLEHSLKFRDIYKAFAIKISLIFKTQIFFHDQ